MSGEDAEDARIKEVVAIFNYAAQSFGQLATMTSLLKSSTEKARSAKKWTNEEIKQLKGCVERFGHDLASIAERMKSKTAKQIKAQLDSNAGSNDGGGAGGAAAPALPPRDGAAAAAAQAAAAAAAVQQQQAHAHALQAHALAQQQQQQQLLQQQYVQQQAVADQSGKRKADFDDDLSGANARARLDSGQAVQLESAVSNVQTVHV